MSDNNDIQRSAYTPPDSDLLGTVPEASDPVKAYIGPKNTDYYLQKFKGFDNAQGNFSWNWSAFFVTWPWMFYRKMWMHGLIYMFGIPGLLMLILVGLILMLAVGEGVAMVVYYVIYFGLIFVIYPMFANKLYYNHINRKIKKAKASGMNDDEVVALMASKGGTSNILLVLLPVIIIMILGILAAIAIPAYQEYVLRAREAAM